MHRKFLLTIPQIVIIIFATMLLSAVTVLAATGTTDSNAVPGNTYSYTLEDLWNRLNNGTVGSQSTFTEPSIAPGTGTMYDLNDLMGIAPALDNANGAIAADVLTGKTFWGLTNGAWGLQTGSIISGSNVNGGDGFKNFNIPDGYYAGNTATANDSNLLANNIKSGVNIFGVTGTLNTYNAGIPKTGQTISYDPGDDGDLELGVDWPNPRFTDNNDGTVTDNLTGLVWLQSPSCGEYRSAIEPGPGEPNIGPNIAGYWTALAMANSLYDGCPDCLGTSGDCNLSDGSSSGDWRLPNLREMQSLIDYSQYNPALPPGHPFTEIQPASPFFTSTTGAADSFGVWQIDMQHGGVFGGTKALDTWFDAFFWLVRDGQ